MHVLPLAQSSFFYILCTRLNAVIAPSTHDRCFLGKLIVVGLVVGLPSLVQRKQSLQYVGVAVDKRENKLDTLTSLPRILELL